MNKKMVVIVTLFLLMSIFSVSLVYVDVVKASGEREFDCDTHIELPGEDVSIIGKNFTSAINRIIITKSNGTEVLNTTVSGKNFTYNWSSPWSQSHWDYYYIYADDGDNGGHDETTYVKISRVFCTFYSAATEPASHSPQGGYQSNYVGIYSSTTRVGNGYSDAYIPPQINWKVEIDWMDDATESPSLLEYYVHTYNDTISWFGFRDCIQYADGLGNLSNHGQDWDSYTMSEIEAANWHVKTQVYPTWYDGDWAEEFATHSVMFFGGNITHHQFLEDNGYDWHYTNCWSQVGTDGWTYKGSIHQPYFKSIYDRLAPANYSGIVVAYTHAMRDVQEIVNLGWSGTCGYSFSANSIVNEGSTGFTSDAQRQAYGKNLISMGANQSDWNDVYFIDMEDEAYSGSQSSTVRNLRSYLIGYIANNSRSNGWMIINEQEAREWFLTTYEYTPTWFEVWNETDPRDSGDPLVALYESRYIQAVAKKDNEDPQNLWNYTDRPPYGTSDSRPEESIPSTTVTYNEVGMNGNKFIVNLSVSSSASLDYYPIFLWDETNTIGRNYTIENETSNVKDFRFGCYNTGVVVFKIASGSQEVYLEVLEEGGKGEESSVSICSINNQGNNTILQDQSRYFNWTRDEDVTNYSIRISNTSAMDDIFLQLDNITISSGNCTNTFLNTSVSASPHSYNYWENSTHCFFYLPYVYNITSYGYDYYQVRTYST